MSQSFSALGFPLTMLTYHSEQEVDLALALPDLGQKIILL